MKPEWRVAETKDPWSEVLPGEVLVFIPSKAHGALDALKELAKKPLEHTSHYLRAHAGFSPDGNPFMALEWLQEDKDPLEKRFLVRHMLTRLKTLFSPKKIVIYLSGPATAFHKALCDDLYFMNSRQNSHSLDSLRIVCQTPKDLPALVDATRFRHHQDYRQWINDNPDDMTSLVMAERLSAFANQHGCKCQVFDVETLKELGLNLLVAVGQAAQKSPSRLIILGHNLERGQPLALVGKGVTFDTGGINVKPYEGHVHCMKNDMGGAALMAHLFMALVTMGYDKPLLLAIPACENLVGELSVKPGTVIKSYGGHEVLIEHTDAEGRLILADALSYVDKNYSPRQILVAATLTTAALRQFTNFMTPVYFSGEAFQAKLARAGKNWGERFVFWDEFIPFALANQTKAADLTNMGRMPQAASVGGGSAVAAHFLKAFVHNPMIHFDIFATCWNWSGDYPGTGYGATGAPFNSLFETLMDW